MLDPAAAARELEDAAVRDLGFVGALINSNVNGRYFDDKFFWPVFEAAEALGVPIYLHPQIPPKPVVDAYYSGFAPEVSAFLSIAGVGWHIDTGVHCLRLILGGVFDRFPAMQIIVGHNFEILSWAAWRMDYSFPLGKNGGLKRTIKEYLRENFYGGILAGEYLGQEPGAIDSSWSLSYQAFLGLANTVAIDRVSSPTRTTRTAHEEASREAFDRMPINVDEKEKIAHLNAERLLGLGSETNGSARAKRERTRPRPIGGLLSVATDRCCRGHGRVAVPGHRGARPTSTTSPKRRVAATGARRARHGDRLRGDSPARRRLRTWGLAARLLAGQLARVALGWAACHPPRASVWVSRRRGRSGSRAGGARRGRQAGGGVLA